MGFVVIIHPLCSFRREGFLNLASRMATEIGYLIRGDGREEDGVYRSVTY